MVTQIQWGHNLTYLDIDISDPAKLLEAKEDTVARFVGVMVPILNMFQLPPNSVNIFYDLSGSTITFNHNKSIFLNLRYYEAWRRKISFPIFVFPMLTRV